MTVKSQNPEGGKSEYILTPDHLYDFTYSGPWDDQIYDTPDVVVRSFLTGEYVEVLERLKGQYIPMGWSKSGDDFDLCALNSTIKHYLSSKNHCSREELNTFLFGMSCLILFMQGIQTGSTPVKAYDLLIPRDLLIDKTELLRKTSNELDLNGDGFNDLIADLLYLFYAKTILSTKLFRSLNRVAIEIAQLRVIYIHQRITGIPVRSFMDETFDILKRLETSISPNSNFERVETLAAFYIEASLIYIYYKSFEDSNRLLKKACDVINFSWKFTGALGKRTKFQTFDVPQLVVSVDSGFKAVDKIEDDYLDLPENVKLLDDVILDHPIIDSHEIWFVFNISSHLTSTLSLQKDKKELDNVFSKVEILTIIQRVIVDMNNWYVAFAALYLRSKLEISEYRKGPRAVLQLQVVKECVMEFLESGRPLKPAQLGFLSYTQTPFIWELKNDYGEYMLVTGAVRESLDIFTELKMWEKVALCHRILKEEAQAEKVIKQCIADNPTPRLYCALGDLKNDPSQYEKAWELSKHRYPNAAVSLGISSYSHKRYEDAIEYLTKALYLNPIHKQSWFTLGCSAVKLDRWDLAIDAFKRVISIAPDDVSSWCNLSTCYIQVSKRHEARMALKETLKYAYDNQDLWCNYIVVCMSTGEIMEAISGIRRVIDISSNSSKEAALQQSFFKTFRNLISLTSESGDACGESYLKPLNNSVSNLVSYAVEKLGYIFEVLLVALEYYKLHGLYERAFDLYFRAYRICTRDPDVERSAVIFEKYAGLMISLTEFYNLINNGVEISKKVDQLPTSLNPSYSIKDIEHKVRSALESFVKKTEVAFGETDRHKSLSIQLRLLVEAEQNESNNITSTNTI